ISLPGGSDGTPYTQPVSSSGGTAPVAWSIAAGALPAGLSLNGTTGVISGTPVGIGPANFTIRATDTAGATATHAFGITISPGMLIVTNALPGGTKDAPYSQQFKVTGGTPPLTYYF